MFRYVGYTDGVTIYDGGSKEASQLAKLSGNSISTYNFTSSGPAITIWFQSSHSPEGTGFSLEYSKGMYGVKIDNISLSASPLLFNSYYF